MTSWKIRLSIILLALTIFLGGMVVLAQGEGQAAGGPTVVRPVWGEVVEVTPTSLTLNNAAGLWTLALADTTTYQVFMVEEATAANVQAGDRVQVIADLEAGSQSGAARRVIVLPEAWDGAELPATDVSLPDTASYAPKAVLPCKAQIDGSATTYASPQAAVDVATGGDLIKVSGNCVGVFVRNGITQSVYVDKSLTLRGGYDGSFSEPPDPTTYPATINADQIGEMIIGGRVMVISDAVQVTVENLTLSGGNSIGLNTFDTPHDDKDDDGGGILVVNSTLNLVNSTVYSNITPSGSGGGLYNWSGTVLVDGSSFIANIALYDDGGAIYTDNGDVTVQNGSFFSGNFAYEDGGAIYNDTMPGGNPLTVDNSTFTNNTARDDGGAIYSEGPLEVTNSTFMYNFADSTGGAIYADGVTTVIQNSTLNYNYADSYGGALYHEEQGTLLIENSTFNYNSSESYGGALYSYEYNTITINNSTFNYNNADSYGGAFYNEYYNQTTINNSIFNYNNASSSGGGIYNDDYSSITVNDSDISYNFANGDAGGLYFEGYTALAATNSTFNHNTATGNGGGIYNNSDGTMKVSDSEINHNTAGAGGGGIWSYATTTISNTTVTSNTTYSGDGGGIYTDDYAALYLHSSNVSYNRTFDDSGGGIYAYGPAVIENSLISHNVTRWAGGGIYVDDDTTINNSTISDNATQYGDGGGIYVYDYPLVLNNSTVSGNTAANNGGGIYNDDDDVTLNNSTVSGNTAAFYGGGIYNDNYLYLNNSTIAFNTAGDSDGGGGLYLYESSSNLLELRNTVIGYNSPQDCEVGGPPATPTVTSYGYNVSSDACVFLNHPTDLINTDPLLEEDLLLNANPNGTLTHKPASADSPLIDGGSPTFCPATDQRSVTRPQDGDLDGDARCDVGAVELLPVNLAISKTVNITQTGAGWITYTLTVSNTDGGEATGLIVSDELPGELYYVSSEASQGSYDSDTGAWDVGTLEVGATATLWLVAHVPDDAAGLTIVNTATISQYNEIDQDLSDNSDSATIYVSATDLTITKTVDITRAAAGEQLVYTVVVSNPSGLDATGVVVEDAVPLQTTFVSTTTTQGSYDPDTRIWSVGVLSATEWATMTVTVEIAPDASGEIWNVAEVAADQADADASNNTASVVVTVGSLAISPIRLEVTIPSSHTVTRTLSIYNQTDDYLDWTLVQSPTIAGWLTHSPSIGVVDAMSSPAGVNDVIVTFNSVGLDEGTYTTRLQASSNLGDQPAEVELVLTVENYETYLPLLLRSQSVATTTTQAR